MKILYIGSTPDHGDEHTLRLEQEITELQRRFSAGRGEPVECQFFPAISIEEFPSLLSKHQADILHISSHGKTEALTFADVHGEAVSMSADHLGVFLKHAPPRVLYLNACESHALAERASEHVPFCIGTNAPISNGLARASAALFYECILLGRTVQSAFETSRALLECLKDGSVRTKLFERPGSGEVVLHSAPRLVAKFSGADFTANSDGEYEFDLGLVGCPRNTNHVVYFTDDSEFAEYWGVDDLEEGMCTVSRSMVVAGETWEEEAWSIDGDVRMYAAATTAGGDVFCVPPTTVCSAVEEFYRLRHETIPVKARTAMAELRAGDGTRTRVVPKKPARTGRRRT